ncbi:murein hydrolase activator EnvC family protein [Marinomonas pollencensis]|uniref:Septal ring factor EnvC (AmiA/AmiB activator) n=1 Tax=Marinomonas pollencensis TaxID=491954 RepID=A0A3E0DKQ4_9GAMM|nr:peptidoglycan DD-metalloendopeptidase family protein [Marinomonas pollencensis]REG82655.1 septal ring factor EnvC (AmiA/AmiB activator) [Marinomonas pollencensis]
MTVLCRHVFCVVLLLLSSLSWAAGEPQTPQEAKQQIQALQKDLQKLNAWLKETKSQRSDVEKELESKDKSIQDLLNKIKNLQQSLKQGEQQLGELQQQQLSLRLSIQKQNEQIAAQLRAVYRSGNQEGIKLLLNGPDSATSMRLLQYNRYFSTARQSLINGYANEVNDLNLVEKSLRQKRAQQAQEEASLIEQRKQLSKEKSARRTLLAKLDKDLAKGSQRSQRLVQNQQDLKEMLKRLEEALADVKLPDQNVPFSSQKGKLVRPLRKLVRLPTDGKVNLGGVTLKAQEGTEVHAIFNGRVVFSDWLRGFGFLMIIDHGDGYMSLYGYNQSLLKEVGEWVNSNDVVATVGSSGGPADAALFFAIRHNGAPLTPLSWVRSS